MLKHFTSDLRIMIAAIVLAGTFGSCSSDETTSAAETVEDKMSGDAVNFTVATPGAGTRAFATLENKWTVDDEMAICEGSTVYKYKATATSSTSGGRVTLTPSTSNTYFWSPEVTSRTFSAWYPYSDSKPTAVAGATDQRSNTMGYQGNYGTMTDSVYCLLDLLYAPDITVGYKQSVDLEFYHQMCRIVVTVNSTGTKGSKPVTSITFGKDNVAAGGTLTPGYTGAAGVTASWSVSQSTSVQMRLVNVIAVNDPTTIRQYTYECIVPPQSLAASAVLFQITTTATDGTTTTTDYIPSNLYQDAPVFQAGYQYNFMLTLSRAGLISVSTVSVNDWTTEHVTGLNATVPDAGY